MNTLPIPPLHDIDIKHLRLFKAVVECGGLSAAGEATGLGTSAISRQLAALEIRVGCPLCVRGRSGFQLTEQGHVAYAAALRLLDAIDEFREVLGTTKNEIRGALSLWLIDHCPSTSGNPVSVAIGRFHRAYPHVRLTVNVATPDLVERAVAEKKAGVGSRSANRICLRSPIRRSRPNKPRCIADAAIRALARMNRQPVGS